MFWLGASIPPEIIIFIPSSTDISNSRASVFKIYTKYYTNITLYKLGVSNYIGSSDFFCNDVNSGMCTTVPKYATLSDNFKSPIKINVTTIDSMNFTDVDFIKIDAEGADKKIILGAMETINTYHPTIQI